MFRSFCCKTTTDLQALPIYATVAWEVSACTVDGEQAYMGKPVLILSISLTGLAKFLTS